MPRILCITSNLPRWQGDSTTPFVLHLAQDLSALGWQVDLLAPHAPGAQTRERLGGVPVERFRYLWPDSAQTICYQGGALINLRRDPLNRLKLPALVGMEVMAVARRVLTRPYDLIHSHWILPQGFAGEIAATLRGRPHVVTVHGGDLFGLKGAVLERFKRSVLERAEAVTVNSSYTESGVRRIAPAIRRLARIPMGVSVDPLTAEQRARSQTLRTRFRVGAGPLILFVGRLVEEKGVADLLEATALLAHELPDLRLILVGEGQDRPDLEQQAAALGVSERTGFLGWVEPEEVPAYLAAADCLVGPSRTATDGWQEAQGLAFAEAMAAGVPVIATRHGGIPDTVIHEETGLLVPERNPTAIAAAIRRLHQDPALARRLAEAGTNHARSRLSRESSAAAFADLFAGLVARREGGR